MSPRRPRRPRRPLIEALSWDDENEAHVARHIAPELVDELIEYGQWLAFENSDLHPPGRLKLIGPIPSGEFITAIIEPISDRNDYGAWSPITAWESSPTEIAKYGQYQGRNNA